MMNINEQLPCYPTTIQGELRLILQNKDLFLLCYKYLEEYRKLFEEQNRIITKNFIEEQITIGEDEIKELSRELNSSEIKLQSRMQQNQTILGQLTVRGLDNPRHNLCTSHSRRCTGIQLESGPVEPSDMSLFENIALAIEEIQKEIRDKLKPLCDFYRDLFYLQLHFSLVLSQVCNYCMPLVTDNIGLIDRIFFWTDRPEFELIRKSGEIADRLKDIYTRTQSILTLLVENVMFLKNKVELQRNLEKKFQERIEMQQREKDRILRKIHNSRQDLDVLDEENDRLVGVLVKLDPRYVGTDHFNELAEYSVHRDLKEGRLTPENIVQFKSVSTPSYKEKQNKKMFDFKKDNTLIPNNLNRNVTVNDNSSNSNVAHKFYPQSNFNQTESVPQNFKENINPESFKNSKKSTKPIKFDQNDNSIRSTTQTLKERLMSKTKEIFDSKFQKKTSNSKSKPTLPTNNKTKNFKVFEGEILAELSQLSSSDTKKRSSESKFNKNKINSDSFSIRLDENTVNSSNKNKHKKYKFNNFDVDSKKGFGFVSQRSSDSNNHNRVDDKNNNHKK